MIGLAACAGPRRYAEWTYEPPTAVALPAAHASDMGFDAVHLERVVRGLAEERFVQIRSLLIARRGKVVLEIEDRPGRLDEPQDLRSTTKSITGLLLADAALRGEVDLDAVVGPWLGRPDHPQLSKTRLEDLLSMRSGLDCDDGDRSSAGQEDRMYRHRDWIAFWASAPALGPPGETARYCTGNLVAAGAVLEAATGERMQALADRRLFNPIGVDGARWATFDRGAGTDTGGHLEITPRELLRVGQLVLEGGRWQGRAVLHADAVRTATTARSEMRGQAYGLGWWLGEVHTADGRTLRLWETKGNGGQHLFILPDLELVVAFTGGAYNHPDAAAPYAVMAQGVLPAIGVRPVAPPAAEALTEP